MFSFKSEGKLNLREIIPPIAALLAIIFVFAWPSRDSAVLTLGTRILLFVILAVSWGIFSGPTKYISLAHAAFFGIGIYATAIFGGMVPIPILILLGGIFAFIVAVLMGAVTLRLRGVYFTIFTFGLGELLRNLLTWIELTTRGSLGRFQRLGVTREEVFNYLLLLLVVLLVVAWIIKRSRFGKALVCIGESEEAAAHVGVNTTVVKVGMFAISSFFVGAVGATIALTRPYIDPPTTFEMGYSFMPVLMIIFGGMGNLAGGIVGAAVFTYLQSLLLTRYPFAYPITIGLVMILAILFMPQGIVGLLVDSFERIAARIKRGAKSVLQWTEWENKGKVPVKFCLTLVGLVVIAVISILTWVRVYEVLNVNLFNFWMNFEYNRWLLSDHFAIPVIAAILIVISILLMASFVLLIIALICNKSKKGTVLIYVGFGLAALVSAIFILSIAGIDRMQITVYPVLSLVIAVLAMMFAAKRPVIISIQQNGDGAESSKEEGGTEHADT